MQIRTVTVTYRKKVNDNNYGDEAAEATFTAELGEEDLESLDGSDVADMLLNDARKLVYAKLDESPSMAVRRALRPQRQEVGA